MGVVLRQAWGESSRTVLMGYLTISTNVRRYQTHHRWHFFLSGRQPIVAHALCMQHSPTAAALLTSFLVNHAPNSPEHWLQDLGSHAAAWVWVMSQKDWRNQGATGWILTMHWYSIWVKKMRFSCFPVLPGSAEAQVIWGGIVKRLFIAYCIGNIFAKKYQNAFTCVKVIVNQRWDVFWNTVNKWYAKMRILSNSAKFSAGWPLLPAYNCSAKHKSQMIKFSQYIS